MRASELMSATVVAKDGVLLGPVRDLRIAIEPDGSLVVSGVVVGGGGFARIAHAWGFAEGRAQGPWLFRRLTDEACRVARFAPADEVRSWGPDVIELDIPANRLRPLAEVVGEQ